MEGWEWSEIEERELDVRMEEYKICAATRVEISFHRVIHDWSSCNYSAQWPIKGPATVTILLAYSDVILYNGLQHIE